MDCRIVLRVLAGFALSGMAISCSFLKGDDQNRLEEARFLPFHRVPSGDNIYRYQSDYRGPVSPGKEFDLSFGRSNRHEVRFKIMLIGNQTDTMSIQAVDRGPRKRNCVIENVPERTGCVLKVKSDARHFLLSIKRDSASGEGPVEVYLFSESDAPVSFYESPDMLKD